MIPRFTVVEESPGSFSVSWAEEIPGVLLDILNNDINKMMRGHVVNGPMKAFIESEIALTLRAWVDIGKLRRVAGVWRAYGMGGLKPEVIAGLAPGIRGCVMWLVANGFHTCDSGDGYGTTEHALDHPHVMMNVAPPLIVEEADRLARLLKEKLPDLQGIDIQATYNPFDGLSIMILAEETRDAKLSRLLP